MRIIDLTLPIKSNSPLLPAKIYLKNPVKLSALGVVDKKQQLQLSSQGYEFDKDLDLDYGVMVSKISMPTHGGTNIDAPRHFISGGIGVDELPLSKLVGECFILDIDCKEGEIIQHDDVKKYENDINAGDMVLIRTGWTEKYFGKPNYLTGIPGVSEEVADFLVSKGVKAVAHDCFPDIPTYRLESLNRYLLGQTC